MNITGSGQHRQVPAGASSSNGCGAVNGRLASGSSQAGASAGESLAVGFPLGELPAEAARAVVLHLQPGVVMRLREGAQLLAALEGSCKEWRGIVRDPWVWKTFIRAKFGENWPIPDDAVARQIYYRLHRLEVSVCTFDIAWLNTEHLQVVRCPGALGNQAVQLTDVCWLDLQGTVTDVPAGTYQVVWRMAFRGVQLGYEPVTFDVSQGDGGERVVLLEQQVPTALFRKIEEEKGRFAWVALTVGTVKLQAAGTVRVTMRSIHDGSWKSGVVWDSVRFEPVRMDPGVAEPLLGANSLVTYHAD